jgi:hypothetical protein
MPLRSARLSRGVWDWQASARVLGPVLRKAADAREWQRAAHRDDAGTGLQET